jgi:putative ABC transport system ATP-binding protein
MGKMVDFRMNSQKPLIVCENLVKIYKVADLEVVALQGLDLVVPRGEMLGIVGTSGSGKTTLMNTLGGLDRPSAGRVSVDDIDLLSLTDAELNQYQRAKVGFVWQQTSRNLIPYLTAQENIELPMSMAWITSRKKKREWAEELLNSVGLYHRRYHRLTQLSGGEQQRIAIAVSLANKPVLLLGDEPTGEVDSVTAQVIMDTFRRLGKMMDITIIIVTHDPRIAEQVDRVVAIRDGKISTETIRQVGQLEHVMVGDEVPAGEPKETQETKVAMTLQEFVVLDSAGRLQIPKEIRDQLGIGKRAEMEMVDGTIVIRPVAGKEGNGPRDVSLEEQIALLFEQEKTPLAGRGKANLKKARR